MLGWLTQPARRGPRLELKLAVLVFFVVFVFLLLLTLPSLSLKPLGTALSGTGGPINSLLLRAPLRTKELSRDWGLMWFVGPSGGFIVVLGDREQDIQETPKSHREL